jgi:hypothetical protein
MNKKITFEILVPESPGREGRGRILVGGVPEFTYRSKEEELAGVQVLRKRLSRRVKR